MGIKYRFTIDSWSFVLEVFNEKERSDTRNTKTFCDVQDRKSNKDSSQEKRGE